MSYSGIGAALALLLSACGGGGSSGSGTTINTGTGTTTTTPPTDVTIQLDAAATGTAVNPLVLGSNVQWVNGGDNLLLASSLTFDSSMVPLVQTMAPTVLRYPGGQQSDLYDWTLGIGPLGSRGTNLQAVSNTPQITYMGSGDMIQRVAPGGSAALFTVKVDTGTAAEAAAWVQQMNVTGLASPSGQVLPPVTYWEIGNEPYLSNPNGSNPNDCEIAPAAYAAAVNAFVPAMRAVDPTIKIGIALSNDRRNGIVATAVNCQGFAATVLGALTQSIDFISLHNAYLPYSSGADQPAAVEFAAAMGSTQTIAADFAAMRSLLQNYPGLQSLPFAVTEYNALFSPNSSSAYYYANASPMGALYVADALRLFAGDDEVLMANTWSLSGNDHWGAIHPPASGVAPYGRPVYEVFRLFSQALKGVRLAPTVASPNFDAPSLGFSAAASALPLVTTLATEVTASTGATVRLIMINKDYSNAHVAGVSIANGTVSAATLSSLTAANVLETDDLPGSLVRSDSTLTVTAPMIVNLPAHSIELLTLTLAP